MALLSFVRAPEVCTLRMCRGFGFWRETVCQVSGLGGWEGVLGCVDGCLWRGFAGDGATAWMGLFREGLLDWVGAVDVALSVGCACDASVALLVDVLFILLESLTCWNAFSRGCSLASLCFSSYYAKARRTNILRERRRFETVECWIGSFVS
jgi:hypothetical protein